MNHTCSSYPFISTAASRGAESQSAHAVTSPGDSTQRTRTAASCHRSSHSGWTGSNRASTRAPSREAGSFIGHNRSFRSTNPRRAAQGGLGQRAERQLSSPNAVVGSFGPRGVCSHLHRRGSSRGRKGPLRCRQRETAWSFRNAGPPETFVEQVGDARGLEDVVHVELDVPARPGDREIRHQLKQPLHDLPAFLQATEQTEARRPIAQRSRVVRECRSAFPVHSAAASYSPATKCASA